MRSQPENIKRIQYRIFIVLVCHLFIHGLVIQTGLFAGNSDVIAGGSLPNGYVCYANAAETNNKAETLKTAEGTAGKGKSNRENTVNESKGGKKGTEKSQGKRTPGKILFFILLAVMPLLTLIIMRTAKDE